MLSLDPTTETLKLDFLWQASPFVLTATEPTDTLASYRAELWLSPEASVVDDATPLAAVVGSVADGVITFAFSGSQMHQEITANKGRHQDFWLQIGGLDGDDLPVVLRGGWVTLFQSALSYTVPAPPGDTLKSWLDAHYIPKAGNLRMVLSEDGSYGNLYDATDTYIGKVVIG